MRRLVPSRTCRGRDASRRVASIGQRLARDARVLRTRLPGRRFASDVAHARTGGRRENGVARLPLCRSAREPLQVCLAVVSIWRQTGGRRITVRRPLLPRVFLWGIQRWYLTAAKRALSPVQRMLQMWVRFPQSPPPFPPVALDRAFAVRVVVAIHATQCRSHGGAVSSPGTRMHAYGIAPRRRGQVFAALHRSCAKVGRLKRGPFQDRSNADLHACVRV